MLSFMCRMFLREIYWCPGCFSALSSLRPGAAEWLRLAQKIPFLRGKWSVHNLGQWYLLVPHRLPRLLLPSSSFIPPLYCLITPRQLLPTVHFDQFCEFLLNFFKYNLTEKIWWRNCSDIIVTLKKTLICQWTCTPVYLHWANTSSSFLAQLKAPSVWMSQLLILKTCCEEHPFLLV